MAAITAAVVVAAGSAYAANRQASGAKNAARMQGRAADAATAEQARQFDLSMAMTAPRRQVENQALNQLAQLYGLGGAAGQPTGPIDPNTGQPIGVGGGGAPDYSAFYNSPDYQFALQQGEQSAMRGASAMGNLRSGNTLAALTQYGSGLATQNFGNYINRLEGLAGMGADQAAANMRMQQGQLQGQNYLNAANARASGVVGAANAQANFGNQLAQLGGYGLQQWGSAPKSNPLVRGANTTYQTPPYIPPGLGGNPYRVA